MPSGYSLHAERYFMAGCLDGRPELVLSHAHMAIDIAAFPKLTAGGALCLFWEGAIRDSLLAEYAFVSELRGVATGLPFVAVGHVNCGYRRSMTGHDFGDDLGAEVARLTSDLIWSIRLLGDLAPWRTPSPEDGWVILHPDGSALAASEHLRHSLPVS